MDEPTLRPRSSRLDADFDAQETAWVELLAALDPLDSQNAPSAGFSDRVMARWAVEWAPPPASAASRRGLFSGWIPRFALAASIFGCGLALAASLWLAPGAFELVRAVDLASTLAGLLAWVGESLARGVARGASTWNAWRTISDTAGQLFSRPQTVALLATAWLVAAGALSALNRLLSSDRSLSHG